METPSFLLAFGAGLLSFLSPCVLPLVPAYLGLLSGLNPEDQAQHRGTVIRHAVAFLVGFSLIFLALGALANSVGTLLIDYGDWVRWVGGGLIMVLGLSVLGVLPIPFLKREVRAEFSRRPTGYLGSAVIGLGFAAGWTPCMGPILATVLLVAAQNPGSGVPLLLAYVIGFSIPFLASAIGISRLSQVKPYLPKIERFGGIAMVATGILLVTNGLAVISAYFVGITGFQGF